MRTREYEAMFLLDNQAATEDFEATSAQVDQILEKHGAEIVQKEKWDERKLAYEIKGHRRATYYLVYLRGPTDAIAEIDRDVQLNEVILRHLVIALEEPIDEHVKKRADEKERLAEESRRSSLSGWGDRGDRRKSGPRRDSRPREETPGEERGTVSNEGEAAGAGSAEVAAPATESQPADKPAGASE